MKRQRPEMLILVLGRRRWGWAAGKVPGGARGCSRLLPVHAALHCMGRQCASDRRLAIHLAIQDRDQGCKGASRLEMLSSGSCWPQAGWQLGLPHEAQPRPHPHPTVLSTQPSGLNFVWKEPPPGSGMAPPPFASPSPLTPPGTTPHTVSGSDAELAVTSGHIYLFVLAALFLMAVLAAAAHCVVRRRGSRFVQFLERCSTGGAAPEPPMLAPGVPCGSHARQLPMCPQDR